MINPKTKNKIGKTFSILVMMSFIAPIAFLVYKIGTTTNDIELAGEEGRVKSDYILMLLQCILGIFAMLLPGMLTKKFKVEIPGKVYYLFVIFLYASIFLGEIRGFYYTIPYWDTILHTFSRWNDRIYRFFSYRYFK